MVGFLKYLCKRIFVVLTILIGLTFLSFCLTYLSPSDPAEMMLLARGIPPTEGMLESMRVEMGLDKPFFVQYSIWLWNLLHGDMGISLTTKKPVFDELLKCLPNTIILTTVSIVLTIIISIPISILCVIRPDGVFDNMVRIITYLFASLPSFFIALLILYIFGIKLKMFPIIAGRGFKGMIMPTLVLTFGMSAWYIRQVRAIVMEQLSQDYVTGCHARGIPQRVILFHHVLKNSWLPIITLIGMSFGGLLGGAAIVESIFTWQGIGKYAVDAIEAKNYPAIQGYVIWMALIYLAVNLLVDLSYTLFDPRMRNTIKQES